MPDDDPLLPARDLLERALALAARRYDRTDRMGEVDPDRAIAENCAWHLRVSTLEAAAWSAGTQGDPALVPLLVRALWAWTRLVEERDRHMPYPHPFAEVLGLLLHRGGAVDATVRALASHPDGPVRKALADGLATQAASFVDLLDALSGDADPEVRRSARRALEGVVSPPWWKGVFPRDPVPLLSEEEAGALAPKLARWVEIRNDRSTLLRESIQREQHALLDEFPDVLARDVLPGLWTAWVGLDLARLASRTVRTDGHVALVVSLLERLEYMDASRMVGAISASPGAKGAVAARAWLAAARARPETEPREHGTVAGWLLDLAKATWPTGADATAEFADLLAQERFERFDQMSGVIQDWAAACPECRRRWRVEAMEGWLAATEVGKWTVLWRFVEAVRGELSTEERRAYALRALSAEGERVVVWGMEQLLGAAADEGSGELLERLLEDSRARDLMAHSKLLVEAHGARLLALLRDGRVGLGAASQLVVRLAGPEGTMQHRYFRKDSTAPGPLTPEDREAWRRLRDASSDEDLDREWMEALMALPAGPIRPEDRPFLERARVAAKQDAGAALGLVNALAEGGTAEDLAVVDEVLRWHSHLDHLRPRMIQRLKLSGRRGGSAPPGEASGEWMDED